MVISQGLPVFRVWLCGFSPLSLKLWEMQILISYHICWALHDFQTWSAGDFSIFKQCKSCVAFTVSDHQETPTLPFPSLLWIFKSKEPDVILWRSKGSSRELKYKNNSVLTVFIPKALAVMSQLCCFSQDATLIMLTRFGSHQLCKKFCGKSLKIPLWIMNTSENWASWSSPKQPWNWSLARTTRLS